MCSFWEFQLSSAEVEANDSSRNLLLEMPNGYFFEGDTNTGKPLHAVVSSWIQKHAEFDICNPDPTKHFFSFPTHFASLHRAVYKKFFSDRIVELSGPSTPV